MQVVTDILKLLNFNVYELVVQTTSFLILLGVMRAFFWKPVLKILDDRKRRVTDEFEKIDVTRKEVEQLKITFEAKMRTIEEAAQAKIQEAVIEGKRRAEDIEIRAREAAQKAVEHGNAEIQFQIVKAKEELKKQTIELTIQAAQLLVEKKFTAEDDKLLVADFVNRVDKMTIG